MDFAYSEVFVKAVSVFHLICETVFFVFNDHLVWWSDSEVFTSSFNFWIVYHDLSYFVFYFVEQKNCFALP